MQSKINQTEAQTVRCDKTPVVRSCAGKSLGVRWRTLRRNLRAVIYQQCPLPFQLQSLAYTIAQECRSSLFRIGSLCKGLKGYRAVDCGPVAGYRADGYLVECKKTRTCSEDIHKLSLLYPWLTPQEVSVLVQGWRAGAEWGQNDAHKCSSCMEPPIPYRSRQTQPSADSTIAVHGTASI